MLAVLILLIGGGAYSAFLVLQDPARNAAVGLFLTAVQGLPALAVIRRMRGSTVAAKIVLVLQAIALLGLGLLFFSCEVMPVDSMPFVGPSAAHPFNPQALVALVIAATLFVVLYVIAFRWLGRLRSANGDGQSGAPLDGPRRRLG